MSRRTFVIAEIGINHNGDLEIAKRLIEGAAQAGADAVKFQKRDPDLCGVSLQVIRDPRNTTLEHGGAAVGANLLADQVDRIAEQPAAL